MKHIIVTGTSRGIGYELVQLLAKQGNQVLALSRNCGPVNKLELDNVTAFDCDICNENSLTEVKRFIEREWQKVDVLINNAGSIVNKPFSKITMQDFRDVYDVNVFGVVGLTQLVIPFMSENGHVVTVSSMGGVQGSMKFPGLSAYSSSKGAVITLTELLSEEYKESGPSFNVLALGAVQTEMLEEAFPGYKAPTTPEEMADYIAEFSLNGHKFYNGKLLQVSNSTP